MNDSVFRFDDWLASLPAILYGGDYNPEQWLAADGALDRAVIAEDLRLMREARVNIVSIGIFSWSALQPSEHTWTFEWLDWLLNALAAHGIRACLATATAAQPAWLSAAYPDVLPVNEWKQRHDHGNRMNYCPTSPFFRDHAGRLARALAERYGDHPALALWHVSNEYGPSCYCDRCAARFRGWLEQRYGTLDALNLRWTAAFWGHTYTSWAQIQPPTLLGEQSMQALLLDYRRFMSDMNLECFQNEAAILRAITPAIGVTTNFHGLNKNMDYFAWAPHLDVIAWDSYPAHDTRPSDVAFSHNLMRGLGGGKPWLLMEQTPSQVQWRPVNPLKRPGVMRLQSYQAIAHGSDAAMFFQWRQSRGAAEMYHGAVVGHAGHANTRVFREVAALGVELAALGQGVLAARPRARVAMLFSWPNWWAVESANTPSAALAYLDEIKRYYGALWGQQVAVDLVHPDAALAGYDLVLAPLLNMVSASQAAAIEQYIAAGGTFVSSYFSGVVDEDHRAWLGGYPGPLRRALGIWVEEFDPLPPGRANTLIATADSGELAGSYSCDRWCEVLHLEGAQALAKFGGDFYAGYPAVTEHAFGAGRALYVATRPDTTFLDALVARLRRQLALELLLPAPAGVEVAQRHSSDAEYTFVLNHGEAAQQVRLPQSMRDLLTGQIHSVQLDLPPYGVSILTPIS